MRQCYPGRTGVSKSSCVIFFREGSKSYLKRGKKKRERGPDSQKSPICESANEKKKKREYNHKRSDKAACMRVIDNRG